jgi:RHS repeat-associated protein
MGRSWILPTAKVLLDDANGNVTNDFLHTYAWDASGRPVTVDGVGITYDALGRVAEQNRAGVHTQKIYSPTGFQMQIVSRQTSQYSFSPMPAGGATVWSVPAGAVYYRHADWLGSSRFASTSTPTVLYDGAHAPFGEQYANSGTSDLSFTGMDQDTSSNLYDFPAREYGIQGRWPSPDPAGIAAVDPSNPQSWNRYAYVDDNPLCFIDPTGLFTYNPPPPLLPPGQFDNPNDDSFYNGISYNRGGLCIKLAEHERGFSLSQAQQYCGLPNSRGQKGQPQTTGLQSRLACAANYG